MLLSRLSKLLTILLYAAWTTPCLELHFVVQGKYVKCLVFQAGYIFTFKDFCIIMSYSIAAIII